jgi:hypothetical protein
MSLSDLQKIYPFLKLAVNYVSKKVEPYFLKARRRYGLGWAILIAGALELVLGYVGVHYSTDINWLKWIAPYCHLAGIILLGAGVVLIPASVYVVTVVRISDTVINSSDNLKSDWLL